MSLVARYGTPVLKDQVLAINTVELRVTGEAAWGRMDELIAREGLPSREEPASKFKRQLRGEV